MVISDGSELITMRKHYRAILKKNFHLALLKAEDRLNLKQAQMAVLLAMDDRSYADLIHGKSSCSGVTLALFLINCCDNPKEFLLALKAEFDLENLSTSPIREPK